MKTRILPLLALAGALFGCVQENHASPEFTGICANPAPSDTGCSYAATCEQYALFNYYYDPFAAADLEVPIEMRNQLADNSDPSSGRINTNDAVIQQFNFEYLIGGNTPVLTASEDVNFTLPAASSKTAIVPVIPASLNGLMRTLPAGTAFVVAVRAAGRYADERYFETGPFRVPAGVATYSPPLICTAPDFLAACPKIGQSGSYACLTP
ncbi:MAG TPA: hypothetical protein VFR85_06165 [Anaeromyxobacteraceae bacterium]|nr:hypothetical protein [Anaeromyxobacteraceae bacterium]